MLSFFLCSWEKKLFLSINLASKNDFFQTTMNIVWLLSSPLLFSYLILSLLYFVIFFSPIHSFLFPSPPFNTQFWINNPFCHPAFLDLQIILEQSYWFFFSNWQNKSVDQRESIFSEIRLEQKYTDHDFLMKITACSSFC